MQLFIENKWIC